eukprot:CAMPEP_0183440682 /NCGR_PEP_ID=MMETSP0370-20130417/82450_1 /TAXON_ID=268820 /ORGANISM="Peridinium aciculiferum, Strain PAER-2" /LENGTH=375 /DNA_ID=CAMNT_0025629633 /DNA_START=11 /DNA_END=1138 /DNA_ORIENTATION=+
MTFFSGAAPMPMNSDLAHLAHDEQLAMKIMRKRQEEMERRTKLQNPRLRQGGVPHDVLSAQVTEKRAIQAAENEDEAQYAEMAVQQDHLLNTIETIKEETQRRRQEETIGYSMANLRKEQRREYCLSDPKEYTSAFITLPDDQLGPCSMTKFQGEAIDKEGKKRAQKQTADDLMKQMQEKRVRQQAEKDIDRFYDQKAFEASQICAHCENATNQEMHDDKIAEARENLEMAAQKRQHMQMKKQREAQEKHIHTHSVMNSDLLTEVHDYKVGSNGKLMKGEFKRLSIEEEADVYNQNAHLVVQSRMKAKQEADAAKALHSHTLGVVAVLGAVEEEKSRQAKEKQMAMVAENQRLAAAKKSNDVDERRKYLSFHHER